MKVLKEQLKTLIKRVLKDASLYSEPAAELVFNTGCVESNYRAIKQYPRGPATSFWQCEPFTACDIWKNYLLYRSSLRAKVVSACQIPEKYLEELPTIDE